MLKEEARNIYISESLFALEIGIETGKRRAGLIFYFSFTLPADSSSDYALQTN